MFGHNSFSASFKCNILLSSNHEYYILHVNISALIAGFTMFIAMTFPFFSALLGFFGGFAFSPTTYFVCNFSCSNPLVVFKCSYLAILFNSQTSRTNLPNTFGCTRFGNTNTLLKKSAANGFFLLLQLPSIMWLLIYRPKALSLQWLTNWVS